MGESPSFWAYSIEPGTTLKQAVPRGASVCLTSAVLSEPCDERVSLWATSGGMSAVLCNLFTGAGHEVAKLGQPFHADFDLEVRAGGGAIHVSGFSHGDLGPSEVVAVKQQPAKAAKGKASAPPPAKAPPAKVAKGKPAPVEEDDDDDDDDDEDDDDDPRGAPLGVLAGL